MKKLNELLDDFERGRIDEGLLDAIKKGVARLKKIKVKMIAQNFFKKHPGLLDAVKQYLSGQMKEEQLDEAKFARKLILIGAFLAIAAGIFPMKAAASEPVTLSKSGTTQAVQVDVNVSPSDGFLNYVVDELDKSGGSGADDLLKIVNSKFDSPFGLLSNGELVKLDTASGMISFINDAQSNEGGQFVIHGNDVPQTGGFEDAGERQAMLKHLVSNL